MADYVSRRKERSQEVYDDIVNKVGNYTVEDYVEFQEQMIGDFDWLTGEYSGSVVVDDLERDMGFYFDNIKEYVGLRLVELYGEELTAIGEAVEAEALQTIDNELALIDKDDHSVYIDDLKNSIESEKQDYQQQGESEREKSESNDELKKSLDEKQEGYKADAEAATAPTLEKVRKDVELELEKIAKEDLRNLIAELLGESAAEVSEEHFEVQCPDSHGKVDAWDSSTRSLLETYPVDTVVESISDASQNNTDRKNRLGVLVRNATASLISELEARLADLEAISEQEDPAQCQAGGQSDGKPGFGGAEEITSPLVIDLDNDGIETLSQAVFTYFDHDANGFAERTGWVAPDDGLLVMDLDGDGRINSGRELLGSNTLLPDGTYAQNGFEALAALDENLDGTLDALDSAFQELQVWQDLDSDARVDDGELMTLREAGLASISTQWQETRETDASGNEVRQRGSASGTDGGVVEIADVWFDIDPTLTITAERLALSDEIRALPNARGFGRVHNLDQAMARDPVLQAMVQGFVDEPDDRLRRAMLDDLIYQWTGVAGVDPYSRDPSRVYGHVMDARQLEALEALVGRDYLGTWCWGERDPNPHGRAAPVLIAQYEEFKAFVYGQLMAQSHYSEAFELIGIRYDVERRDFVPDLEAFSDYLKAALAEGQATDVVRTYGVLANLGLYSDRMEEAAGYLRGDVDLAPWLASNLVEGGDAADTLSASAGDDLIVGNGGDDRLFGKSGDDTYLFERGDGADLIYDSAGSDQLSFGQGVTAASLRITRNATALFITLLDEAGEPSGDRVQIDNVFDFDGSVREGAIESFAFSDGFRLSLPEILGRVEQSVTDQADTLYGTEQAEVFEARQGDDTLYGGAGDDVYRFAPGDGQDLIYENAGFDSIEFHGGIRPEDLRIERTGLQGEHVVLTRVDADGLPTGDRITVAMAYQDYRPSGNRVEQVRFVLADGSVETMALDELAGALGGTETDDLIHGFEVDETITGLAGADEIHGAGGDDWLFGGSGDDSLHGESGNDILVGGAGNDRLQGGAGDDVYRFGEGDGHDRVVNRDSYGVDVLEFDAAINPKKVRLLRVGDDLLISIDRNADSVQLDGYFSGDGVSSGALKEIRFADGSLLSVQDVMQLTLQATQGADYLEGFGSDDSIAARAGDDIVYGGSGNDLVSGDQGSDLLFGQNGNDMLFGEQGQDQLYGGLGDDLLEGGAEADRLFGGSGLDLLRGGDGEDSLSGGAHGDVLEGDNGDDFLAGDSGDDALEGGNGDDILRGGAGDDCLRGGAGNDTYEYARGDGHDRIETGGNDVSGQDRLALSGFEHAQLWLVQQQEGLLVSFAGADGSLLVEDWQPGASPLDEIEVAGMVAYGDDIERLVAAMAVFDAPDGAGEVIPQDVREQLQPVLASSWHPAG
ncbi:calcium-binding protein [Marinobacterium nitratireducens]|uniref:calcium-binding protein n=1 Tax=Marinobacterium nitratireducens TaxID=518897 RepID=UPI001669E4DB|nr:calcium-binding protein [Marinobacterium nitratireducens]